MHLIHDSHDVDYDKWIAKIQNELAERDKRKLIDNNFRCQPRGFFSLNNINIHHSIEE